MAREHGRILCRIWSDKDFCARSAGAQRLYVLLLSQRGINNAGVLPLRVSKWARGSVSTSVEHIEAALEELCEHRYVVVDRETEEVLVRTFISNDGVAKQPNVLKNALRLARQIESSLLRRALARELRRLHFKIAHEVADEIDPNPSETLHEPLGNHGANPSRNPSGTPREPETLPEPFAKGCGDGVGEGVISSFEDEDLKEVPTSSAQTIIAEWIDRCAKPPPKRVVGQIARHVGELLAEGQDADDVRRGIAAWMDKGLHPSVLPSVVNEVMNRAPPAARPSTTDQRFLAAQALKALYVNDSDPEPPLQPPRQIAAGSSG